MSIEVNLLGRCSFFAVFLNVPMLSCIYSGISGWGACRGLKGNMEERACGLAVYIIENRTTVREAAKKFGVSKSTVHTVVPN